MRVLRKILCILMVCLSILCIGFYVYASKYYKADETAINSLRGNNHIKIEEVNHKGRDVILFQPDNPRAGLIFYPGGKVQPKAYAPLMRSCAENGILAILIKMPHNLAILDLNAADGIKDIFPEVTHWYIGGHSLGGAAAAMYLEKNSRDYEGLILLAAYSTKDLSGKKLKVISIYGSEDRVLDLEKYKENRSNLGQEVFELVIDGGCHAGFGNYGRQKGDGTSAISKEEQQSQTTNYIVKEILK